MDEDSVVDLEREEARSTPHDPVYEPDPVNPSDLADLLP
jgi:hypothetical protein